MPGRIVRQFAYQQIHHLEIAARIWREKDAELFFLFEHKPIYSWPIYLALLLKRCGCFFIVHGIQQKAGSSPVHWLGFAICRLWTRLGEFYAIHLELGDEALPASRRFDPAKTLVIPHPHPLAETARTAPVRTGPVRVGIVGMLRRDKPIAKLLELLLPGARRGDYQLVVGTPFWQKESWLNSLPVVLRDTATDAAYSACLDEIDLLVADFLREDYEFRPSGVVIDAAMHDCAVLAPNYPVIREEIEQPVAVGAAFNDIGEVADLVTRHAPHLREDGPDFAAWRAHRSMAVIGPLFAEFLQKRGAATR